MTPGLAGDGFLPEGSFEGWDLMLKVLRLRREEKEEQKRLEKEARSGSLSKKKKLLKDGKKGDGKQSLDDVFAIEYTKRGDVREWDEGKKRPT